MSRTIHVHLNVRGALMNYRPRDFKGMLVDKATGRPLTPREAKAALLDVLARGIEAMPIGEPCEGFDFSTGCPGHDMPGGGES